MSGTEQDDTRDAIADSGNSANVDDARLKSAIGIYANTTEAKRRRHAQLKSWYTTSMHRQRANRYQMALDEDYYDSLQYTPEEEAELLSRGQAPVVNNEVAPIVDFMLGTERRMRVDFTVSHRTDDSPEAGEEAQAKQQLLKFLDDLNMGQFVRSEAADDQYKAGVGWTEPWIKPEGEFPIGFRSESWRNVIYDDLAQSRNPEDWRYLFRFRELDLDIAEMMIPRKLWPLLHKARVTNDTRTYLEHWNGVAMQGMDQGSQGLGAGSLVGKFMQYDADAWLNNPRERVLLIEAQYSAPCKREDGTFGLMKRHSIMTQEDMLFEAWSPFNHNRFTLIPRWCYRRKKDGAPYGMIRRHRSRQDALNKLESKAIFRMSTRQVLVESDALDPEVMDIDDLADRVTDPSAVLEFKKGAVSNNMVRIIDGTALAQADVAMAERYVQSIRQGGVSIEDRGNDSADLSGKARAIRRDQSSVMIAEPLDNSFLARQIEGEILLSLAEQYHVDPMTFTAPGRLKSVEYIKINQTDPKTGKKLNDIARRKAVFTLGEQPWKQDMAESAFETLTSMMGELAKVAPQVVISILDIVFELHPALPRKAQILARIRQATGMSDPDQPETPEQKLQAEKKAAKDEAQYQAEMEKFIAEIAEAKARGVKLNAEAVRTRLTALYEAAQAAAVLTERPEIAPVADELAKSAGFQDENGDAALGGPVPTIQQQPEGQPAGGRIPDALQADGALRGIETPENDGLAPQGAM
jgi:hypothetical protein